MAEDLKRRQLEAESSKSGSSDAEVDELIDSPGVSSTEEQSFSGGSDVERGYGDHTRDSDSATTEDSLGPHTQGSSGSAALSTSATEDDYSASDLTWSS